MIKNAIIGKSKQKIPADVTLLEIELNSPKLNRNVKYSQLFNLEH
jgi:hypothetical protein